MNTQNERASAIQISLPWRGMLPLPDARIDGGDRAQMLLLYRAFYQSGPVVFAWSQVETIDAYDEDQTIAGYTDQPYIDAYCESQYLDA